MKKATKQNSSKTNSPRRQRTDKPLDEKQLTSVTGGWGASLGSTV